jgi:membrane-bound serine protease (ClpP class)
MVALMRNTWRMGVLLLIGCSMLLLTGPLGAARAQTSAPTVIHLSLDGVVDPFMANYLRDGITSAQEDGAAAVLITIDTPGGLISSTREITQAILNAGVPILCYVSPPGARAGSAGSFVLMSCPVAAMAPGTEVGAATPIGINGVTLTQKVTNDAAASMRALAEHWGRNAEVASTFVTEAASISAQEALEANVIDLVEPTTADLLSAVDGRTYTDAAGAEVTIHTAGATIEDRSMAPGLRFFHSLFDPNLAFIFFWLGLGLIVLELAAPGHIVSGTVGGILFLLAIASFGLLPVRLLGIVALLAAFGFFALELRHPGLGIWSVAAVAALVAGGFFLYSGPSEVRVSPLVILPMAALTALFFGFVVSKIAAIRRMPRPASASEALIGREGTVLGAGLTPDGIVRVASEEWQATTGGGSVPAGARVRVTAMKGFRLTVEPVGEATTPVGDPLPQGARGGRTT